jgi:hypothetical protein
MEMSLRGTSKNVSKPEARSLIKWMTSELCIDKFKNPIFVEVHFVPNLKKNEGCSGDSIWEDIPYRPREFLIRVDAGMSKEKTMITLIHEMIHVQQYARNRLRQWRPWHTLRWEGKVFDMMKVKYDNFPWEKEAYKLEEVYYRKYKEKYKSTKVQQHKRKR